VHKPSTGSISAPKEVIIAYLPQHLLTQEMLRFLRKRHIFGYFQDVERDCKFGTAKLRESLSLLKKTMI